MLVGHEPRAAISCPHCSPCCAVHCRRALRPKRRWSAARRSSIPWRCANSTMADLASAACCCRSGRRISRSAADNCLRWRRWFRSARRSTASSIAISRGIRTSLPNETIGVGEGFDFQLFDRAQLDAGDTRFVLAGIVNRMDRAYVDAAGCGEIRLIYRLTRTNAPGTDDKAILPRLPMTLNLVLKAKGGHADRSQGQTDHLSRNRQALACRGRIVADRRSACGEVAGRRRSARSVRLSKTSIASRPIFRSRMRRNRRCAISAPIICLKVFRYDAQAREFLEAPMENQIDRDRILADDNLKREFKVMAARSQTSGRVRSRHGPDPGKISRQRRDRRNAGRI